MVSKKAPQLRVRRLFWDIEVSPNIVLAFAAGFKKNINHDSIIFERKVICIAYKWEGEKEVTVLRWDAKQDDTKMLRQFTEVANEADELVAHYGDRFDVPWFRTRCLILGLDPLPPYKTIDTKAWASKYFYFNSNKLDYIAHVLGHGRKLKTDFDLWKRVLMDNCPAGLAYMCKYCGVDVKKLEKVYHSLKFCIQPKTHAGVLNGNGKWTSPRTGSENVKKSKTIISRDGNIRHQMLCLDDGSYFTISQTAFKEYQDAKPSKPKDKI